MTVKMSRFNNDNGMGWKHYRDIDVDAKIVLAVVAKPPIETRNVYKYEFSLFSKNYVINTIDNNLFDGEI